MRNLLFVGMMLFAAFMAGWFKVQRDGERTTIEIDKSEIRSDTRRAIDKGREVLERVEENSANGEPPASADRWTSVFNGSGGPSEQPAAESPGQPAGYGPQPYGPPPQGPAPRGYAPRQAYGPAPNYPPASTPPNYAPQTYPQPRY